MRIGGGMAQFDEVEQFVEASRRVTSGEELNGLLQDICRELGFDYFALVHHVDLSDYDRSHAHVDSGTLIAITNYPEHWVEEFIRDRIVENDPILLASERSATGFAWDTVSDLIRVTSEHRDIRMRAVKAGVVDGFTVPAHVPGEANGSCSFAVGDRRTLPAANLLMAEIVGIHAFQAARTLVRRTLTASSPTVHLTTRQRDCVSLAARGLSDREIARMLAISVETVKQHLKESRDRLNAANRTQLVVRAAYHGFIPLSPLAVK